MSIGSLSKRFLLIVSVLVLGLQLISSPAAIALSEAQREIYDRKIYYYDLACGTEEGDSADRPAADIELGEIAEAHNIHSIAVRKLGTNEVRYHNASNPPNAVASTIKLVIVDAALSIGVSLNEKVKIDGVAYYGADDSIKRNQTVTVRDAIKAALGAGSSNNGANAIIKAAGGPQVIQDKALQLGYAGTEINSYFKDTSSTEVNNNSVAEDITQAMNTLYNGKRQGDGVAQEALKQSSSANGGNYSLDSEANKWGLRNNPPSRGNSAVFKVKDAKFIITMYTNEPNEKNITQATKKVLSQLDNITPGDASQPDTAVNPECCESGSATVLNGNSNEEKIWNYLIQEIGLNDKQAAGIMGNIEQESGFSPTALNPGSRAYGIVQWYAGRNTALVNFAKSKGKPKSDMGVQLEFLKKELEGPYKARVLDPIKKSDNLAEITRIWLERFEIPCIPGPACDGEMNIRMPNSTKWLKKFGGGPSSGSSTESPDGEPAGEGCGNSGSGEFSPIQYGDKKELIERALKSKNIAYGNYGPAGSQKNDVRSCLTENTLVGLVAMAEQSGAKIPINALASDHGGCNGGAGSLHNSGRAIDIGYYGNGNPRNTDDGNKLYSYLYRNRKELKIDELIWKDPPRGQKCVHNLEPTNCYTTYSGSIGQHYHHIHVGFK